MVTASLPNSCPVELDASTFPYPSQCFSLCLLFVASLSFYSVVVWLFIRKWVRFPAQLNKLLEHASERWDWPILTIQILKHSALRQAKQLPAACRHWHFKMKSQVAAEEAEAAPAFRQSVYDRNFNNSRASSKHSEVFKCQINIRPTSTCAYSIITVENKNIR